MTNAINRRTFLKGTAAALVLVAGGGVYRAADRGVFSAKQGPAYEPWINWRAEQPGILNLVRAAILASNPHNIQPWLFRVTDKEIDLYVDTQRNLGAVDPFQRELYIGVGCAVENVALAAAANGYAAAITLMPTTADRNHAARITLTPAQQQPSALYEAIPLRRTNRAAYDTARPMAAASLDQLRALSDDDDVAVFWFATPDERRLIGDATIEATGAFIADKEQLHDSESRFRQSGPAIQQHRDGVTIDAQGGSPVTAAVIKMLPDTAPGAGANTWRNSTATVHVPTAAAFGVIAVRDARNNAQRLSGGRLWQRMHLHATTQGVAMQPLSQVCERTDREAQLGIAPRFGTLMQDALNDSTWQALMVFRLGYPTTDGGPSPRRAVENVVL